ncbi:MAG: UDP-N-acetylmuramate--L-alanine ligase [Candidatus Latescibacteria bacterium]|nr:UDP-N-acetylmuramate--L-alanine ligase [Candidatus Latescibacterota bacterium]
MLLGPLTQHVKNIHLIGIGGSGMSGIAEILVNLGFTVTGSDLRSTTVTERLEFFGARIFIGHIAENITGCDVVVYSSAVKKDNPEIIAARERKIPVIGRPEMLAELMRMKYGICIAGTHGKTTTTSMTGRVLTQGNIDPTIIVGGRVEDFGGGAKIGQSHYFVLEADEYDRTFLKLTPVIAVVTNIDTDHLDCYKNLEDIRSAFLEFVNKVPFYGSVILCIDDNGVQSIIPGISRRMVSYGISRQAEIRADNITFSGTESTFDVFCRGLYCGKINLKVPGIHNIRNALAALSVGYEMSVPFVTIAEALGDFKSVGRRFEIKGEENGIMVVDDFAHHPTEIIACLEGVRAGYDRRIVAVFQPHLYSRTKDFHKEFGRAFMNSDVLVVTDVYPAREEPVEGVTGKLVSDSAQAAGHRNVSYVENRADLANAVKEIVREGDIVITFGAGDVHKTGTELLELLRVSGVRI